MGKLNANFLTREDLEKLGFRELGQNVLVHSTVVIVDCSKVSLGDNVRIDPFCVLSCSGSVQIGSRVHIASNVALIGGASIQIGDFVNVSHGSKLFTSNDDYSGISLPGPMIPAAYNVAHHGTITVGRHVIIGANSIIMPEVAIGEGSALGALSFVPRSLEPWGIYVGIPVRRIRDRKKDLLRLEQELLTK